MSPSVELELHVRRGAFELSLELACADPRIGVFGPSGAGKSTLLLALSGLLAPERVRLAVDGELLLDSATGLLPPAHRRRVGLVFQDHRLFPHRDVRANLRYGMRDAGGALFDEVVELLELGTLLGRGARDLSGGEAQRVAIGRALLAEPRLLLLDEPLASLDRGRVRQILPFLRRVHERFAIPLMFVSHDLTDLLSSTDELVLLEDGRAAAAGRIEDLVRDADCLERLHDRGLVFSLPGRVARREDDALAWIELEGRGALEIACADCADGVGESVEVLLRPDDVVLARPPLEAQLSLTNRFPGRVASITVGARRCLVVLDCGLGAPVLAEVTQRAVERLGLEPGVEVVALAKALATRARATG